MPRSAHAATANEAKYFLMVSPCQRCGKGPWLLQRTSVTDEPDRALWIDAVCKCCDHHEVFEFICERPPSSGNDESINPSDSPSRLIDLGQWLSLFYRLLEQAADERTSPSDRRLLGYRAALCLHEALKFYADDDELPDESAFFSEQGRSSFREHPESFAREKLLHMRSKLPKASTMAANIRADRRKAKKHWWQFWRK